jgi:hypothetical protein
MVVAAPMRLVCKRLRQFILLSLLLLEGVAVHADTLESEENDDDNTPAQATRTALLQNFMVKEYSICLKNAIQRNATHLARGDVARHFHFAA